MTEPSKSLRKIFLILLSAATIICALAAGGLYYFKESLFPEPMAVQIDQFEQPEGSSNDLSRLSLPTASPAPIDASDLGQVFEAFWTTRNLINDNFINQPVDDEVLSSGAASGLRSYLEEIGLDPETASIPSNALTAEQAGYQAGTPEAAAQAFKPFWDLWVRASYLDLPEDVSSLTLMRQALAGMVSSLDDDYTNYFDPDLAQRYSTNLSGEYEGIGAWVDTSAEYLTIISPIKDTPAEEAGLKPGDMIIGINGDDMTGVDPATALKRVLGPAGSKVTLTIQREDINEPFDVALVRRRIVIPYIETEILQGEIAYINLARFYDGGAQDFHNELAALLADEPSGLILDLRSNGGGYLHTTVGIVSEFIEDGNILIEEFGDGSRKNYPAHSSIGLATEIPLVILVNGGSASASEILAGAIRDYGRGTIIGETTFGKGSVQLPITLPDNQGMVSITIARWLTPNGSHIQSVGIEPDIFIEMTEEDIKSETDPQLDRALEYLLTGQ